jgi:hypothetical protein
MRQPCRFWIQLTIAVASGILIWRIDSGPHWDDTGITAAMILGVTVVLGFSVPAKWWIWAFAVGIWILLGEIIQTDSYGSVLALVIALAGSSMGALLRKWLFL